LPYITGFAVLYDSQDIAFLDSSFSWFSSVPPGKCRSRKTLEAVQVQYSTGRVATYKEHIAVPIPIRKNMLLHHSDEMKLVSSLDQALTIHNVYVFRL
jgi:hypothetical protein